LIEGMEAFGKTTGIVFGLLDMPTSRAIAEAPRLVLTVGSSLLVRPQR
jgi:hypothetical protein